MSKSIFSKCTPEGGRGWRLSDRKTEFTTGISTKNWVYTDYDPIFFVNHQYFRVGALTLPILTSNDSDLKYACLLAAGTAIAIASIKHLYEDYLKHQKKALIDKFKFDYDNESIKNKIFSFFGKSENEKKVEILEKKRIRYEQIVKAEKKAEGILKLLSATFRNKVVEAEKENGLIILEAYYGDFMGFGYAEHKRNGQQQHKGNGDSSMSSPSPLNKTEEDLVYNHRNKNSKNFAINYNKSSLLQQNFNELKNYIDIKIQLQCMVHNNKLQIPKNSYLKDRIVDGFYDPSMDVSEVPVCLKVKIKYSFRGKKFKGGPFLDDFVYPQIDIFLGGFAA